MANRQGGCGNKKCAVAPRCTDCQYNFVKETGDICAECAPITCELCGNTTSLAYPFKFVDEERAYKVCNFCHNTKCRKCGVTSYSLIKKGTHLCGYCAAEQNWIPEGKYPDRLCIECQQDKVLNEEELCRECYATRNSRPRAKCLDCRNTFEPLTSHELLCDVCKPACRGCGHKFNPSSKLDTLCTKCVDKAFKMDNCALCHRPDYLNAEAHCSNCKYERHLEESWCSDCHVVRVLDPVTICDSCKDKNRLCPQCNNNMITASEYICKDCLSIRGALDYISKVYNVQNKYKDKVTKRIIEEQSRRARDLKKKYG